MSRTEEDIITKLIVLYHTQHHRRKIKIDSIHKRCHHLLRCAFSHRQKESPMRSVNRNYAINTVTRDEAEMIAEYRRAKEDEKDAYYARLAEQGLLGTEPLSFGQELLRAIDSLEMGFALLFVCGVSAVILGAVFAGESALISSLALSGPILLFIALVGFKDKIFTLFGWKIKYTRAEMEHDDFNHTFGV